MQILAGFNASSYCSPYNKDKTKVHHGL